MTAYNVRDLLGHFVAPRSRQGRMCSHACCRNRRVHPANYPVILPDRLLRRASDDDLGESYSRRSTTDAARAQILHEMDRRDQQAIRRDNAHKRYQATLTARRLERAEAVDHAWLEAEQATNGNMLNRAGRAQGISDRALFTGPESVAVKYASEELLEHWQTHHRPTAAMFAGKDTRVYERYSPPSPRRVPRKYRPRKAAPVSLAIVTEDRRAA
jgi:hypothetical protein